MKIHYAESRSVTFYADKICVTPQYLSHAVYNATGKHALHWILDYVILDAKALLKSNRYTVQQISEMLNFANPSFFGKYFKAATGMSPRAYAVG